MSLLPRLSAACALLVGFCLSLAQDKPTEATPVLTLKGHTEAVYSTAFNKYGTLAATGSFDKSVRLWDAKTGAQIREFSGPNGHQSLVLSVAFSPNGEQIASGGSDNTARVWDVPLRAALRQFEAPMAVNAVAATPDGKGVVACAADGTVRFWTIADGKIVATPIMHPGGATSIAMAANGSAYITGGKDGSLRAYNPADGKTVGVVGAHAGPVTGVALAPGVNQAYTIGEDGLLKMWQFPLPPLRLLPVHTDAVTAMAVSADGSGVLTGGADKGVKLSATATGQLTKDFVGATAAVTTVSLWPNGVAVAAGCSDGKVAVWTIDGKLAGLLQAHIGAVTGINVAANGASFQTSGADGIVRTWAYPLIASRSIITPDRILDARLSPDGKRLITAGADKIARTWAWPAGTPERQFAGHTAVVNAAALTPDNATLITVADDETIRLWNAANGAAIATLAGHTGGITSLAVAPGGQSFVTGGIDGLVKSWSLPALPPKAFVHPDAVTMFAVSPDGARVLTVAADKQARLWKIDQPAAERTYTTGGAITAIAASDTHVALATDKAVSIRVGDKALTKFTLPAECKALAFAPGGATLAVGLADGSVRLFTVADGKEAKTSAKHDAAVAAVAFTPKGDLVVSASADKTVRLWNATDLVAKGKIDLAFVPTSLAVSKDGTRLGVGGGKDAVAYTLADLKPAISVTSQAEVKGVSVDGQRIAVAGVDNRIRIHGADAKMQEALLHDAVASGVAFHPDGKRIVSISADKSLRLWTPALVAQSSHSGAVRQSSITADGSKVIAVGDDRSLRVWDAKTMKEVKSIPTGDGAVLAFSMLADGSKAATGGADKIAKVWNLADGKPLASVAVPGAVQAVGLSPNGLRLAVAYLDGAATKLRVFDVTTGRELQAFADPAGPLRSLLFLADNRTLVAEGDGKNVTLHDVAATAAVALGVNAAIAFHPAAPQAITAGADKVLRLVDLATGKETKTLATLPDAIRSVAASKDFSLVAVASGKSARVIQIGDGKELAAIPHPADVVAVGFNADKTRLVTGGIDGIGRVWELPAGRLVQSFTFGGPVNAVAMHPSQPAAIYASADKTTSMHPLSLTRTVAASAKPLRAIVATADRVLVTGDDGVVRVIVPANGTEERKFEASPQPLLALAAAKANPTIAAGGVDRIVRLWTANDGKEVGTFEAAAPVRALAFSSDAKLLAGVGDDKALTAWSVTHQPGQLLPEDFGKKVQQFALPDVGLAVAFGEKDALFTGSADKVVRQWRLAANTAIRNFQHPNLVDAVAWSPDGKVLATAGHDGVVRTFDIEKNTPLKAINAHTTPQPAPVYSVVWSADGKQLLSASFDQSLKLWDAAAGTLVREFKAFDAKAFDKGHQGQVFCGAISPNGKWVASGSADKRIKLWNVSDGTVIREFAHPGVKGEPGQSHPGGVYQLRFTTDDARLVSVGPAPKNRGHLAVWSVADGKLLRGVDLTQGPAFGLSLTPDGAHALLGLGPKQRQISEAEAVLLPLPK